MAIKYKWLAARLREQLPEYVARGQHQLPTESELSKRYKVSRQTVRQALAVLAQEGLIEKRQGSGSYLSGRLHDDTYNTIGILVTSDREYLYPTLLHNLRASLLEHRFTLQIHVTHHEVARERAILKDLLADPPRALIIDPVKSALPNPNLDLYRALLRKSVHIVFMQYRYPQLANTICISEANLSGSRMLVEYLISQGHTSIGCLLCADTAAGIERYQGMMETLRDHNLPLPDQTARWFHSYELYQLLRRHDADFIKKAVQESLHSCTAILCHNDMIAYELLRQLHSAEDPTLSEIVVVSFDHSYLCTAGTHPFLSLAHPTRAWEQALTDAVLAPLKGLTATSLTLTWEPMIS